MIPKGGVESDPLTVTRRSGTAAPVTVDIGALPTWLPSGHFGYEFVKSDDPPLEVISGAPGNMAPTFNEGEIASREIEESTPSGVNIGSPVAATDPHNDHLTYTLGGVDAASFRIVSSSGQLQTYAALDYETKSTYTVTVTVSDSSSTDTITVTVTVTDAPSLISDRTPQVRDAIVAAVPGVSSDDDITEAHLAAITALDLTDQGITALKSGDFDGLTALTELYLNNNALNSLPEGIFSGLTPLTTLNLSYNDLSSLSGGIFLGLTALTELYLNNNALNSLPEGIFSGLTPLTYLSLTDNDLSSLSGGIFSGLTSLTGLYVGNNRLSALPEGIFSGLTALTHIYLWENDLSSLSGGIFSGLTALHTVWIYDNIVSPLPLTVSLEKVGAGEFKAVAPTGAPFKLVIPVSANNGTIDGSATSIAIPTGSVESEPLTVTRTPSTTAAVTVDIGTLPWKKPNGHAGYHLVKSDDSPLEVISGTAGNTAPTFTESSPATRTVEENTASGVNIGAAVAATDLNNDDLTYTLGGTDAASFRIVSSSGQLQTYAALDYETRNIYEVTITVSDGSLTDTITVTINVTDLISPLSARTPQVRDAIMDAAGVNSADDVTEAHLAAITSLNLHRQGITALKVGDFDGLTVLDELALSNNRLGTLPGGIFSGLTALTELSLSNNRLGTLPGGIFSGLTALTTLNLAYNDLSTLPGGIFSDLTALTELNLRNNALSSLPGGIFSGLTALTELSLYNNRLSLLPGGIFSGLTALTTLSLSYNDLSSLAADIFSGLTALTTLYLSYNDLSSLPEGIFSGRTVLAHLNLEDNDLSLLPGGIFSGLTALTYLNLNNNDLSSLRGDIFSGLTALNKLYLHINDLSSLPAGIFSGLTALTTLYLHANDVEPLPLTVSLEKVMEGQFKAVVPTGAPFRLVLPVSANNGIISGGATTITIPKGRVGSDPLTVTRRSGRTAAVTVDIGTLSPQLPSDHLGYKLVKSDDPPLTVIDAVAVDSPTVTIGVPSGTQTGAFDATITFSETVLDFTQSDVSLTGSASSITAWRANSDNTIYTATITPTASGTVTISVAADVATDAAGTPNTAATTQTVSVDVDAPSVSISVPSGVQTGAFDVTITFTEAVSNFALAITGTASASITARETTDNIVYTATITPTTSGELTLSVPAGLATDAAGNPNTAATAKTVTVDMDPPSVSITVPSGVQTGVFDVSITFTEAVSDFVQSDLSLTGTASASITAWNTTDTTTFTATITPTANGTVTINVAADVATDAAGNPNTAAPSQTVTIEIPPAIPDPATWMPDANLRSAIRTALGLAADAMFTQAQLQQLTELWASESGISDITGLEHATELTKLSLWGNNISDLTPLQNLTNLTYLRLGRNDISNVSALSELTALTNLGLQNNSIVDVAPLAPLVNLTWLRLANNSITDFSALVTLVNVTDTDITLPDPDTTAPGVSISVPSGVQNGGFSVTITFTESVSGFGQSDVSLTGSAASITGWNTSGDNTVYTATITPTASGTVTVGVAANVATDEAGNPNTAATSKTVSVDVDTPTVTIGVPSGTQTGAFDATITFSETVSGFTQSDIDFLQTDVSLGGTATASITNWEANSDNTIYTATITPTSSGLVKLSIAAGVATDAANNPNLAGRAPNVRVDMNAPSVDITLSSGAFDDVRNSAFDVIIIFTDSGWGTAETVLGFTQSDVSLSGSAASITDWQDNVDTNKNALYIATITPTASGTVTVGVAANVATDEAGNPNTAATSKTVSVDVDTPTVTIGVPSGTQTGAFNTTITFSETVSGFTQSEVSLTGSAASITGWSANNDNTVYTATITPTTSGTVTISVAADVATDAAGNPNTAATSQTVTIEIPPAIPDPATWMPDANLRSAIRSALGLAADATFTQAQLQQLTELWASESEISDITGLEHATELTKLSLWRNDISDLTPLQNLTNLTYLRLGRNDISNVSALSGLTALTSLGLQRNSIIDVSPLATLVNLTWLRLAGNSITDFSALVTLVNVTDSDVNLPDPDTTPPGVSISVPSGVQNGAFDVTVTFTEAVSGFTQSDLSLTGTASASITAWNTTDNTIYTATVTPTTSGTVTLNVNAGVATDAANNPNTAATPKTVTADVDRPTVTIGVPSGAQIGAFAATITFSETVSGFVGSDVSLTGSAASITAWSANNDNTVYTATIAPTANGTLTIGVAANVATDAANNQNTAATSKNVTVSVDTTAPGVTISVPSGTQMGAFDVTITFSEAVSGFTQSDLDFLQTDTSLGGTATASITNWDANSDNTIYTATITPISSGIVALSIAAGVATDVANNPNLAGRAPNVPVDMNAPSTDITVPSGVQNSAFDVIITFTEPASTVGWRTSDPVLGFTQSDVSLSGSAASITDWQANGDNSLYTATITPAASGTVTISVNANVATDAAGNPNTAATSKTVSVDVDSPTVTISVPSSTQTGAFDATITFSETVSGFVGSDVSLTGSAASITSWSANSNNTVYTAIIIPTASGTVTVSVAANVATDAADNPNTAATSQTVTIEIPPSIPDPATWMPDANLRAAIREALGLATDAAFTQAQLQQLTELFASQNEISDITGLEHASNLTRLSLWRNDISNLTPIQNLTSLTYLRLARNDISDVSPLSGLTALDSLGLQHNSIVNVAPLATLINLTWLRLAGNSITDFSALVTLVNVTDSDVDLPDPDTTAPGVSISVPSGVQNGVFSVTITFTESVSGFVQADLGLSGAASVTTWSANNDNTVYAATITPTASGTVTVSVAANVATDAAGNPNTAATSRTVTVDVDRPRPTISVPSGTQTGAFDATITFSETVLGFRQSDVSLTGSAASITAWRSNSSNTLYTATITPTASGTVTLNVSSGVATDAAGNNNTAAASKTVTVSVDTDAPGVSISVPSGVQNGAFNATITFTEVVSGFVGSDVSLTGSAASITGWSANSSNTVYTATITPTASGTVTFNVSSGVATDAAGNPNTAATSRTVTVDVDRPTVTIGIPSGTQTGAFNATITFSETVSGFVGSDVSLSGSAASITSWRSNSSNTIYTATITPAASGTVTLNVNAGVATDAAGNNNTAATSKTVTVSIDTDAPGVSISIPSGVQNGAFSVSITFTEAVSGFIQSDLSLSGTASASITGWNTSNNTTYAATITPTTSGSVTLGVAANVATDVANNPNTAASPRTVTVDVDRPTVTIGVPSGIQTGVFDVTITFSERVSGFVGSDVSVTGSAASITGWSSNSSNTVYTTTITPTASGTVTITVAANVATDAAGNNNTAATSKTVTVSVDTDAPGVSISVPSGVQNGGFSVTITFTESVSGFVGSDVSLSGNAASVTSWSANSGNTVYTATITPTSSGTVTITVAANVATDAANNPNTAATPKTVTVDVDRPTATISVPSSTQTGAFDTTITFSETVSGFAQSDVSLTGSAASITAWSANSDNTLYTATITPTASGTVTVSVAANVATDAANNPNTAAITVTITVVDEVPPNRSPVFAADSTTRSIAETTKANRKIGEPVSATDPDGDTLTYSLKGTDAASFNIDGSSGQLKTKVPLDRATKSQYIVTVEVSDGKGGTDTISVTINVFTPDRPDPAMYVMQDGVVEHDQTVKPGTFQLIMDFDQPVTGFDQSDLGVSTFQAGATITGWSGSSGSKQYTATVQVNNTGSVTFTVLANAARAADDGQGNIKRKLLVLVTDSGEIGYAPAGRKGLSPPNETLLLANYPNPFNPETWIPYQLASDSDVQISIYDLNGALVRQLDLGHQRAGYYTNRSRAAYWDGRNELGERVATGIYFYQLQADNLSLLRKMVILK